MLIASNGPESLIDLPFRFPHCDTVIGVNLGEPVLQIVPGTLDESFSELVHMRLHQARSISQIQNARTIENLFFLDKVQ
jgi:hypothetical protein